MDDSSLELTRRVYSLVRTLPRHTFSTDWTHLPANGVYFFFEKHEVVQLDDMVSKRIVRVGTHRENGRFRNRIRQHYGRVKSLAGNKNASVFRRHLGGALLRKANSDDPRLAQWLTQGRYSYPEIEAQVSGILRENFTFACVKIDNRSTRLELEGALIALLSKHPLGQPTDGWLGHHAAAVEIRNSGLWNTQHTNGTPLTLRQLEQLAELAEKRE